MARLGTSAAAAGAPGASARGARGRGVAETTRAGSAALTVPFGVGWAQRGVGHLPTS